MHQKNEPISYAHYFPNGEETAMHAYYLPTAEDTAEHVDPSEETAAQRTGQDQQPETD